MKIPHVDPQRPLSATEFQELWQRAVAAAKAGDRAAARDLFAQLTAARSDLPQAWLWRGHLADEPRQRVGFLRHAWALAPGDPQVRSTLFRALVEAGVVFAKQSVRAEARSLFLEATRLDASHETPWLWLASLADRARERREHLDRVLALNPRHPQALAWKAGLEEIDPRLDAEAAAAKSVLVVDDSLTVRSLVDRTLTRRGWRVLQASDGQEARSRLDEATPELIFLDIDLPDTDGFELCQIIRERPETREIPVVMLSGKNTDYDKLRGKMAGAQNHISKPFRPDDLVEALRQFVEKA